MTKSRLLRHRPGRIVFDVFVGLVWFLSKARVPGLELLATYGLDNRLGTVLRVAYWKARLKNMGENVRIDVGARFIHPHNISIGEGGWIDKYVILNAGKESLQTTSYVKVRENPRFAFRRGELVIGKGCHIAPYSLIQGLGGCQIGDFSGIASGCRIYTVSEHYRGPDARTIYKFSVYAPEEERSLIEGPVVFEGNNALGLNSIVLPGVTIGKNSWVGVCSYVIDDIPPNTIAQGIPARVIKNRFPGT